MTRIGGICHESGGAWDNGEPCGMDTRPGERCDWHTPGVVTALAVAIRTGMVDLATGRFLGDPIGESRTLTVATIKRVVAVQADAANDAEVKRLLGLVPEHYRHLWAYWDLVSVPGTDESIEQAYQHVAELRRLRSELGARLAAACSRCALDIYRDTPGKHWPIQRQRHTENCQQPRDGQGRTTCGCPVLFDWETEDT